MTRPRGTLLAALPVILLGLGACTAQDARDTLWNSVEALARSACDGAGNCRNSCPDGSAAQAPAYRCLRDE